MSKIKIILIIFLLVLISGAGAWMFLKNRNEKLPIRKGSTLNACPEDAKLCPNGIQVERTGENCDFAPCPDIEAKELSRIFSSKTLQVKMDYPEGWIVSGQIDPKDGERSIIIENVLESWKLVIFENNEKIFLKNWFLGKFDQESNAGCDFTDSNIKFNNYYTKLIKADSEEKNCDDAGVYANANDNSRIIKLELDETQDTANIGKILKTFEFVN